MRKMGLAAPILELVPKFVRGERLAILGNQERHIADFRRRECRVQRNVDVDRIAVLILGFLEADATARMCCRPSRGASSRRPLVYRIMSNASRAQSGAAG